MTRLSHVRTDGDRAYDSNVAVLDPTSFLVLWGLAAVVASCGGSPALTCQTSPCGAGTGRNYQVCSNVNGSVSYDFGGQECTAAASDGTQVDNCAMQAANYCVGGGPGTGGSGDTGVACTATFSGEISATLGPCAVTMTYAASSNLTSVAAAGRAIGGTPYTWTSMSFVLTGEPATGTFDQTQSTAASDEVTLPGSQNPPAWLAVFGSGMAVGSATLTITSIGSATALDAKGDLLYSSPHGAWTGVLVDQNPQTEMPDVMQTITF